ncbi:hypothetical protein AURDEDRAFT_132056 [Auricularia subglabra TFB-10046 SS5]|uniref:Uncharacterized protein n=1 Tax=Auricularia subglabra (strain TFB-10046 / SS5) TaxID=717982 RepID=J0CQY8_AURST|nr:hypothetical protein AURDEDRAFT_132056 [Auricularia subglabra TFB-10046 SS5]
MDIYGSQLTVAVIDGLPNGHHQCRVHALDVLITDPKPADHAFSCACRSTAHMFDVLVDVRKYQITLGQPNGLGQPRQRRVPPPAIYLDVECGSYPLLPSLPVELSPETAIVVLAPPVPAELAATADIPAPPRNALTKGEELNHLRNSLASPMPRAPSSASATFSLTRSIALLSIALGGYRAKVLVYVANLHDTRDYDLILGTEAATTGAETDISSWSRRRRAVQRLRSISTVSILVPTHNPAPSFSLPSGSCASTPHVSFDWDSRSLRSSPLRPQSPPPPPPKGALTAFGATPKTSFRHMFPSLFVLKDRASRMYDLLPGSPKKASTIARPNAYQRAFDELDGGSYPLGESAETEGPDSSTLRRWERTLAAEQRLDRPDFERFSAEANACALRRVEAKIVRREDSYHERGFAVEKELSGISELQHKLELAPEIHALKRKVHPGGPRRATAHAQRLTRLDHDPLAILPATSAATRTI